MTAAICVPWRPGVPSREMIWKQMLPVLESTGLPVFAADSNPDLGFNRSEARNRAAEAADVQFDGVGQTVDVFAFLDADAYLLPDDLLLAVAQARATGDAVYPYTRLMSMNPITGVATPRINFVRRQDAVTGPSEAMDSLLISGNVIIPRALYERVGGWDERFTGYGWEDGAMARMLRLLGGVQMMAGTLVCIEHSRTDDERPDFSVTQRPDVLGEYDVAEDEGTALELARRIGNYRAAHR